MSHGCGESRFVDVKRVFEKPLALSSEILLDRERCILCQRCTRFSKEIAGDAFIDLQERGAMQQIGTFNEDVLGFGGYGPIGAAAEDESGNAFCSYYSGNTIQICPVGALTSAAYRFRSRPFDLVSSPGISEHDSSGSAIRTDHRRGKILRRLADNDAVVNEYWITDKDRFAFAWQNQPDRLTRPLVRKDGELVEVSWPEALAAAADGLKAAAGLTGTSADKKAKGVGVLPGGRVTMEDAYAYQKFARVALGTHDVDARTRVASDEEQAFLGANVAGTGIGVTFAELEKAPAVLFVGFEPEDEGGVVFLRLHKSLGKQQVFTVAPYLSRGAREARRDAHPCRSRRRGRGAELAQGSQGRVQGAQGAGRRHRRRRACRRGRGRLHRRRRPRPTLEGQDRMDPAPGRGARRSRGWCPSRSLAGWTRCSIGRGPQGGRQGVGRRVASRQGSRRGRHHRRRRDQEHRRARHWRGRRLRPWVPIFSRPSRRPSSR